jgi:hypothetical protein
VGTRAQGTPSERTVKVVSTLVLVHLFLVFSSYLATVAPSGLQTRILDLARPYLAAFHFDADGIPLNLATNAVAEKAHELEKAVAQPLGGNVEWDPINPSVLAGGDRARRWQRFLTTIAQMGDNQLPSLAAILIEPLAVEHSDATHLRVTRQADLMTTVVDDSAPPPYTTAVLRGDDNAIRFVLVPAKRLASPPLTMPPLALPGERSEPANSPLNQGPINE